ncbi:hypothetical protein HYC85_029115 [Camellia sinensis]|uniref:Uncharacterized protein n=1 Tax=Camellia sinensis TaxID=4442 RepID=A0A7J7G107_CAMSI|nr:hypothetical protein HYC85_029115 [Camellia sinensis]
MTSQRGHKSGSESSQIFSQFSEVQNSANRGNMRHGNGFPSEAIKHASFNHFETELWQPL